MQWQLRREFISIDARSPRADTGSIAAPKQFHILAARPLFIHVQFKLLP
jgi:hypothetical protein